MSNKKDMRMLNEVACNIPGLTEESNDELTAKKIDDEMIEDDDEEEECAQVKE